MFVIRQPSDKKSSLNPFGNQRLLIQADMEQYMHYNLFERRPIIKSKAPAVKWVKEWLPQDVVATGGKCLLLRWVNEATLKAIKEKKEPEVPEPEPEPTTEVLFLCSYEGCGKTFIDAGALRKHSHIHGERQYVCHYDSCGKKFLDSSKLKRHFLIHTGERDFVCPHEGCGKAFSLDFNLRSHMKTHSQENYHICPYTDCGKRYAHEYKLRNHVMSQHEKNMAELPKYTVAEQKPVKTSKSSTTYTSPSTDRPYVCPYDGCEKAYIHEYKLNLHLRREHPGHFKDETAKNAQSAAENDMDEASDQDGYAAKRGTEKMQKQNRAKPNLKLPVAKVAQRKGSNASPANVNVTRKSYITSKKEATYDDEDEDSEETEEEREDKLRYHGNEEDDEETEYED